MSTLSQRLAKGDPAAFAALYDDCADQLYAYLWHRLGSPHDAADALQESLVRLVRHRGRLRQVTDAVAYLFAIARNEAARLVERRQRQPRPGAELDPRGDTVIDALRDPYKHEALADDRECVAQALLSLEPSLREVIELKIFGDLTLAQVAVALDIPAGTAATRYRTALLRLRDLLARDFC